ncbi:MAG TPA: ribonuclease HII [Methylomirabilota bacterium]|nr:ribonuclease HII [Methylomirabilota bacterium]
MARAQGATYRFEKKAWRAGHTCVAGVDEVGRGPLAGPVVAAAVILPANRRIRGLKDSKLLTPAQRETLFPVIQDAAEAVGVGIIEAPMIDRINILEATRRAMLEALSKLSVPPDLVLIDAIRLPTLTIEQQPIIKGDRLSATIAAASIIAKVTRDRLMLEYDQVYPEYGFARHKGYATEEHLQAIDRFGPCPIHRRTFHGVWIQRELFSGPGVRGSGSAFFTPNFEPRTPGPGPRV